MLWRVQVAVRPTLVPLTVDAIPENVLPYTHLANLLSKEDWDKLCRTTARAANYRSPPDTLAQALSSAFTLISSFFRPV